MLEYALRQSKDVTIVDLTGPITLGELLAYGRESGRTSTDAPRPKVIGEIVRQILKQGGRKILLNLTNVTYIDSSGIGELVGAFTSVQLQGGQLRLLNPAVRVVNILRLTSIDSLFPGVSTHEEAAIQSFSEA
ncbi:MAG TPA: STAS domain-containing protein [Terriglobales bacterium]|nr:STAS domain-containing protein [Terriglobales bacterium]